MANELLLALVAIPLVTAILSAIRTPRAVAIAGALGTLVTAAMLVPPIAAGTIPARAFSLFAYRLDAPSALLAVAVALTGCAAIAIASSGRALLALSLAGLLGTLVSADLVSVVVWPLVALVPLLVLTARQGGHRRAASSHRGVFAAIVGTGLLIAGFVLLAADRLPHEAFTLDLAGLATRAAAREGTTGSLLAFWLVLAGLAMRAGIPPLHAWTPFVHEETPTSAAMLFGGPQAAVLGLVVLRTMPLFPSQLGRHGGLVATVLVCAALHAALVGLAQRDLRRFTAYATSTTLAFALFVAFTGSPPALDAAWLLLAGLAIGGALLSGVAGALSSRAGHRHIDSFGGVARLAPWFGLFGTAAMLSLAVVPGFAPFAGTVLGSVAALAVRPARMLVALAAIAVLSAASIWAFHRVFLGPANERHRTLPDATTAEQLSFWPLVITLLVLGLAPGLATNFTHEAALVLSEAMLRR